MKEYETLHKKINQIKDDVDMLLTTHYSQSESGIAGMKKMLTTNTNAIQTVSSNISTLQNQNQSNLDSISQLETSLNGVEQRVTTLEASGGSGSGSVDLTEIEQEIETLQTNVNTLIKKFEYLETPADPFYTGNSYSDYPAGTILKTYDCFEETCDDNGYLKYNTEKIYFCAEAEATGEVKVKLKISMNRTGTILVSAFLNDSTVGEEVIEILTANQEIEYEKTYYSLQFNTQSKANNFYIKFAADESASAFVYCTYHKVEVFAPNADIINKNSKFDVFHFGNYYYLTDCTNNQLKLSQVLIKNMYNMSNPVWENTGYFFQSCQTGGTYQEYDDIFIPSEIGYVVKTKANKFTLASPAKLPNPNPTSNICMSHGDSGDTELIAFCVNSNYRLNKMYYVVSTNSFSTGTGEYDLNVAKIVGSRLADEFPKIFNALACVTISQDGECLLRTTISDNKISMSLGYGTDCTVYVKNVVSSTSYDIYVYVKRFDKIIRYICNYSSKVLSLISTTEIGYYDKFFLMPNGDYFVIKNNQLMFFASQENN